MTVKRKLVVTTIAASLVAGSLAGIPLSNKGLAAQLGLSNVASAATATTPTYADFLARLDRIHTALIAGGEAQKVRDLREIIADLDYATANSLVEPILAYIPSDLSDNEDFKEALFTVFQAIGTVTYSTHVSEIDAIRNSAEVRTAFEELQEATGVNLTLNDLLAYGNAVESAAVNQLKAPGKLMLLAAAVVSGNTEAVVDLFNNASEEVLNNSSLKVNELITWFANENTASREELVDAVAATVENFTTNYPLEAEIAAEATQALAVAFIRAETTGSAVSSNNGRTQTFTLKLLKDITIPSDLVVWNVTGGSNITKDATLAGVVNLASTASTGTATLTASVMDKVIYSENITLTYSAGSVYIPSAPSIIDILGDLKGKIAAATGAEKDKLIKEAIDKAFAAISAISAIDVSKDVSIVDGKATVNVSSSAISKVVTDITAIINALKDAAPGAEKSLPNIVVSFEAGKVDSKDITFNVDADSVKKLTVAGIYGTKFVANGIGATVPVSESKDSKISFNVKNAAATPAVIGTGKAASDVFDFTFNAGGTDIHEFTKPVQIQLPVNTDGIDTDLLTLAKIINGKLEYYGGKYSNGSVTENRDTFSSYVVVENKVSFKDTNKVKAWAGRQIEVMAAKGAIQGRANGAFVPNGEVTRAEFAKMLVRALDLDNVLAKEGFSDVNAADWFAPFVAAASEAGIIKGRTATSFAPNATITRAEMAVMVARGLEAAQGVKPSAEDLKALDAFKDAGSISASLKDGVAFAANNGLVVGDKGKFNPNATATRAQAAVIIYRAFNFKG
ncbi:S-layer homology domain-containing protein [Paenibacillus sp. CF384]|uniref:S-layer homology domain-containing protein n=1 Tax=Paenibacillus sp. CF384 TaxID=1884382 RepID=UPI00089A41FD|nr:S-layer homology domain-containing protein [Paenibacillus sp. CF384]SDX26700.1 S-layer homology domain-containing protein [Paenibacillus sp. CF384]